MPTRDALKAIDASYDEFHAPFLKGVVSDLVLSKEEQKNLEVSLQEALLALRGSPKKLSLLTFLFIHFPLSSKQGLLLMRLSEALLRIPDNKTALQFLEDSLAGLSWSVPGLSLYGMTHKSVVRLLQLASFGLGLSRKGVVPAFMARPMFPPITRYVFKHLSKAFIFSETIDEALKKASKEKKKLFYSFDMLGEGARTFQDAEVYLQAYMHAVDALKKYQKAPFDQDKEISIKLSSLHPRFEALKWEQIKKELYPKLLKLYLEAKAGNVRVMIDAEQSDRTSLTLELFSMLLREPQLKGYDKFGIVIQAYQKRALYVIDFVHQLALKTSKKVSIRLVKGAYWDEEIKLAQRDGHDGYRVFTRKNNSDLMYLLCAKKILSCGEALYGQFATHNIQTVLRVQAYAQGKTNFEFQRLHGMGEEVYAYLMEKQLLTVPVRLYAPVGNRVDLLSYLVRRLMENGVSNSYLTQTFNQEMAVEGLSEDPLRILSREVQDRDTELPLPEHIFNPHRKNSRGIDLSNLRELDDLKKSLKETVLGKSWKVASIIGGEGRYEGDSHEMTSPINYGQETGVCYMASEDDLLKSYHLANTNKGEWASKSIQERAEIIDRVGDLLEERMTYFIGLLLLESGKTLTDAISEVREAVDFCRYYAQQARDHYVDPMPLRGYAGEDNHLIYEAKGIFVCISPWNFPLAIFTGQIIAALVMGNAVLAKPSQYSSIVSFEMVKLMHQAGVPKTILHLLLCRARMLSDVILADQEIDGVCFTGSTETACTINKVLTQQERIIPLIAETGGINAMIVDSTCLLEQTTDAIVRSAFQSAGQRCSALRVLYVQEDIADDLIKMIKGAMDALVVGDPFEEKTDIGPVISYEAKMGLQKLVTGLKGNMRVIHVAQKSQDMPDGAYFMPQLLEVSSILDLKEEAFGPILHVAKYRAGQEKRVVRDINLAGYGLTFGVQTRNEAKAEEIAGSIQAGNVYINEDTIGAVVGVQPFGGRKLSGTGPKAGGPNYLKGFANEKCITNNIAAIGGIPKLYG